MILLWSFARTQQKKSSWSEVVEQRRSEFSVQFVSFWRLRAAWEHSCSWCGTDEACYRDPDCLPKHHLNTYLKLTKMHWRYCVIFLLLTDVPLCACVCVCASAWGCVRRWRFCRHGWREWAGLWGVRVGGAEEDQSYGFAGGRFQRYTHTLSNAMLVLWLNAGWMLDGVTPDVCLFCPSPSSLICSSITPSLPVHCEQF